MSFYTSLTGLNAASAMLGVTSNNISNVGTTGFKRSRADFGDIFATSPLQKASSTVGQGVSLKQVSQEFSQGNIAFSSNALDLAVTGDGFFPMRSADGLQNTYTRNGSFMLNEQYNVVNSAGQRLMAATVDSTGSANVNDRVVLTIPQKTNGEAKQTSQVKLGLNFPADVGVISATFNRDNPATYNKSTAFTVYDTSGNGYLSTVYYVKTRNADQANPTNTWQTHVFVGSDEVKASLQQATDANGSELYVNQYGQLAPYSQVKDDLTTAKTPLFSLNDLTDKRSSVAATVKGSPIDPANMDFGNGVNFKNKAGVTAADLSKLFQIDIDGSGNPVTIDMSYLASLDKTVTGADIAAQVTAQMNKKFGDEAYFDLSDTSNAKFNVIDTRLSTTSKSDTGNDIVTDHPIAIDLTQMAGYGATTGSPMVNPKQITTEQVVAEIQKQLDAAEKVRTPSSTGSPIKVSYDYGTSSFKFIDSSFVIKLGTDQPKNDVFNLSQTAVTLNADGETGTKIIPNGEAIRLPKEQRYGMSMSYDSVNKVFSVKSGTTGDSSSLAITGVKANSLAAQMFGFATDKVEGTDTTAAVPAEANVVATSSVATRGIASSAAVVVGNTPLKNLANNFEVNATNNSFVVTIDGIKGTVVIPQRTDYSLDTFKAALQKGINALGDNTSSGAPTTINGVKVGYDLANNRLTITSGTTGSSSFVKISGSADWGLDQIDSNRGSDSTWIKPTQHNDIVSGVAQPKYIDNQGLETTNGDGFTTLPKWSPVYLTKGQLTFNTSGKLVSPLKGTQLEPVYLAGGKGVLTINVDYSASTQYTSPFAVLSQSQDGAPEGDLVGITIGNDGLVSASFSNGSQKSLAKILLANFSSPTGLRQTGDSTFLSTAASGPAVLGNPGSAGFGTLRAGATERANVDLTQELVDLITAQRNFQANAKAIETSTTMTSAIINLRS